MTVSFSTWIRLKGDGNSHVWTIIFTRAIVAIILRASRAPIQHARLNTYADYLLPINTFNLVELCEVSSESSIRTPCFVFRHWTHYSSKTKRVFGDESTFFFSFLANNGWKFCAAKCDAESQKCDSAIRVRCIAESTLWLIDKDTWLNIIDSSCIVRKYVEKSNAWNEGINIRNSWKWK